MAWRWNNFSEIGICRPSSNPANSWEEIPADIRANMTPTHDVLQRIRDTVCPYALIENSNWRPRNKNKASAHCKGFASDVQPWGNGSYAVQNWGDRYWCKHIFEYIQGHWEELFAEFNIWHMELFWEYRNRNAGWLHIHCNYNYYNQPEPLVIWVSPKANEYIRYEGKAPFEY